MKNKIFCQKTMRRLYNSTLYLTKDLDKKNYSENNMDAIQLYITEKGTVLVAYNYYSSIVENNNTKKIYKRSDALFSKEYWIKSIHHIRSSQTITFVIVGRITEGQYITFLVPQNTIGMDIL